MERKTDLIFTQIAYVDGFALYSTVCSSAVQMGFLLLPGSPDLAPFELTLLQAWQQSGFFLFYSASQSEPLNPSSIVVALGINEPYNTVRGVAWIIQTPPQQWAYVKVPLLQISPDSGQVGSFNGVLPFGHVELVLPSGTPLKLLPDGGKASFAGNGIGLRRHGDQGTPLVPDNFTVSLSFDPASPGLLSFTSLWDAYDLFGVFADDPQADGFPGGELRYFYVDPQTQGFKQLRYPVLPPLPQSDWPLLAFDCEMDPLAPLDGARTRFLFQPQPLDELASTVARTVTGELVTMVPIATETGAQAGLYPAARPGSGNSPAAYLAPLGPFLLTVPRGMAKLSCGMLGTEYLRVASGDVIEFLPSMPACSTSFGTTHLSRQPLTLGADTRPVLEGPYSTSWVRIRPGSTPATRGYYAQPGASVSFGRGAVAIDMYYPSAVSSLVSTLESATADDNRSEAFPMAFYGGVFALADCDDQDGASLASYEKQVIACLRGSLIRGSAPASPLFISEQGTPLPGARTATPQGMLVQTNTAASLSELKGAATPEIGTWRSLVLARYGEQTLSFDADQATGVVDAHLASTLMREQLFLVVNDWERFPYISRLIEVAGFNFEIAPAAGATTGRDTVLVFKYATTQSLADLISAPESWADTDYFIGNRTRVKYAQVKLQEALNIAQSARRDTDDPFADFRTQAMDPAWTGMLAFNAPINGNGMPEDLQMLLAGIDGQLTAHHFGVQTNRIGDGADHEPEILESSLFGVIYHHTKDTQSSPSGDNQTDYAFVVQELAVAINKSIVTQFHCRVGMTIQRLFGREVRLRGSTPNRGMVPNTVVVAGRYQKRGDVGTVTFNDGEHGRFEFNPDGSHIRVIDSLLINGATLVPVSTHDTSRDTSVSTDTVIASRFALSGTLAFAANPFPGVEGLDLYSYGAGNAGVELSNLAFKITCSLNAEGARIGPPQIAPDLSELMAADDRNGLRTGALARMLPLKLQAILHNEAGLDISALGALPVQVPMLTGVETSVPVVAIPNAGSSVVGGVKTIKTQVAYIASKPKYALQFSLPLGSLGALADAHATLDASLIVAWGPSTYTPDDDGAALFVLLPQVTAGAFGFNLQGLLKTTFSAANLGLVKTNEGPAYVLMFNNVALSVFGITLPPRVLTDFILFADAKNPGGGNLGWSLAATQTS